MLEIARQSVPDGYGNSYFWVKPDRIVPADRVRTVGGRLDFTGAEIRPFDEDAAVAAARWFQDQGITTIGVCLLHAYANDDHELRMREILRREHPDAIVSISSEVLREYREYERAMTTLVDAAVKPNVSRYVTNISERLLGLHRQRDPVLRDEVQRRRAVGRRGRPPADHHRAVRPGRRRARRRADRQGRRLPEDPHLRRRRYVDRRVRRPRRRADPHHRGHRRRLPQQDPDDRRRHRRRRRRLDRLALARGHAQGRPALGRRRPRPALLRQGRHPADHHRRPRHPRPDPSPPARRRDPARRGGGARRHRRPRRPARPRLRALRHRHPRDLRVEPGQRAAPGLGQARPRRPRLHADDLRRLGLAAGLPARRHPRPRRRRRTPQPGQRQRLRPADRRRQERLRPDPRRQGVGARPRGRAGDPRRPHRPGPRGARQGGLHRRPSTSSSAPSTSATSARPTRCGSPRPRAPSTTAYVAQVADTFHADAPPALRLRLPRRRHPAGRVGQPPRHRHRPDHATGDPDAGEGRRGPRPRRARTRDGLLRRRRGLRRHPGHLAHRPRRRRHLHRPRHRRGVRLHHPRPPRLRGRGRRLGQPRDPKGGRADGCRGPRLRHREAGQPGRPADGVRARRPPDARGHRPSTRSSSRSSRAPWPASRWRSRPPSAAPAARR